ncbi:Hypothetical predicted protein [Lynx pardinus]|uniref:Uncharacterized protein n=1 Tax=Lynx pardinus TaxID=191816 RepID=A0A485MWS9_LYNPA|nr:Hypothetical predicted protein [Lynx pardinus]
MRRALGSAAGPRADAHFLGAPSPAQRSPSPRVPRPPGCPQPCLVGALKRQLLDLPGLAERGEEDAAEGGSDGRRGSPELRRDPQRLKFLLSRCLFSGSIACGFPHRPRSSQFPPSPPRPANT